MIKCFEANYPESLGVVLVHKSPWIFQSTLVSLPMEGMKLISNRYMEYHQGMARPGRGK